MSQPGIVKNMLRTTGIFAGLLAVGSLLIFFGTRNDAVTVARSIKAGVLTADEVNTAFQNVGGRLVERPIIESQHVKKGGGTGEIGRYGYAACDGFGRSGARGLGSDACA